MGRFCACSNYLLNYLILNAKKQRMDNQLKIKYTAYNNKASCVKVSQAYGIFFKGGYVLDMKRMINFS